MPPETVFVGYRTELPAKTTVSDFSASESLGFASVWAAIVAWTISLRTVFSVCLLCVVSIYLQASWRGFSP